MTSRSHAGRSVSSRLARRIGSGLITILPLVISFVIVRAIFQWLRDFSLWLLEFALLSENGRVLLRSWGTTPERLAQDGLAALPNHIAWSISACAVLLTLFLLYVIGLLAVNFVGGQIILRLEALLDRVPVVTTIYRSAKQVLTTLLGRNRPAIRRVVLVPFPTDRQRCFGFVTNTFPDDATGQPLASVFIATTPNPTTGMLVVLPQADLIETNYGIEETVKAVMSGGLVLPTAISLIPPPRESNVPSVLVET